MIGGSSKVASMLYYDRATIYGVKTYKDSRHITKTEDVVLYESVPCRVVKKTLNAGQQGFYDEVQFNALLLIDNDISIPKGADISVVDINGHTSIYNLASGGYTNYPSHQEIAINYKEKA